MSPVLSVEGRSGQGSLTPIRGRYILDICKAMNSDWPSYQGGSRDPEKNEVIGRDTKCTSGSSSAYRLWRS